MALCYCKFMQKRNALLFKLEKPQFGSYFRPPPGWLKHPKTRYLWSYFRPFWFNPSFMQKIRKFLLTVLEKNPGQWANGQIDRDYFIEPSFCGCNICDSSKMEQNKILPLYSLLIKQETSKDKARCSGWQAGFGKFLKKLKKFELFSRPTRFLHIVNKCISE